MFTRTMEQTLRPKLLPDTVYADAKSASLEGSAFLVWRVECRTEGNGCAEMSTEPCSSVLKNKSPVLKSQAFEYGTDLI